MVFSRQEYWSGVPLPSPTSSYDTTGNRKKWWQPGWYGRAFIICLLSFIIGLKQNRQKPPEIPQEELSKSKRPPSLFILYVPEWIRITTSSQKGGQESMCLAFSASLREVGKQKRQCGLKSFLTSVHQWKLVSSCATQRSCQVFARWGEGQFARDRQYLEKEAGETGRAFNGFKMRCPKQASFISEQCRGSAWIPNIWVEKLL